MDLGDANLQPIRLLGEGGFGRVFLCNTNETGRRQYVCVKRVTVRNPKVEMKMIMEEIYIIAQLKHPNIVRFIRSFAHAGTINIVMEYAENGTVRDVISRNSGHRPSIPKQQFHSFIFDILMGLEYLHIRHVMHRDLKPENMLLDGRGCVKIADFGISAVHTTYKPVQGVIGTYFYMAPEVMHGDKHDFKSDIWSLGCTLYEMCYGSSPFQQATTVPDLKYLVQTLTQKGLPCKSVNAYYGLAWGRVCERMITYDLRSRISLPDILTIDPTITVPYYRKYFDYRY